MKCKTCGHVTRTLNAMREHYLKKHPNAMKHNKSRKESRVSNKLDGQRYCPNCGKRL